MAVLVPFPEGWTLPCGGFGGNLGGDQDLCREPLRDREGEEYEEEERRLKKNESELFRKSWPIEIYQK